MLKSNSGGRGGCFALSAVALRHWQQTDPHVLLTTSAGNIELQLDSQKAPVSVKLPELR
jgi:peptidyl-prolyl cis-trans isomerase A (cyclophilin A)